MFTSLRVPDFSRLNYFAFYFRMEREKDADVDTVTVTEIIISIDGNEWMSKEECSDNEEEKNRKRTCYENIENVLVRDIHSNYTFYLVEKCFNGFVSFCRKIQTSLMIR